MVKEKPFNIIFEKRIGPLCLAYNLNSGNITLPNLKRKFEFSESIIVFDLLIRAFSHEILHKWTHENIDYDACCRLDIIEKNSKNEYLPNSIT